MIPTDMKYEVEFILLSKEASICHSRDYFRGGLQLIKMQIISEYEVPNPN